MSEVAAMLGVSKATISRRESGLIPISDEAAFAIWMIGLPFGATKIPPEAFGFEGPFSKFFTPRKFGFTEPEIPMDKGKMPKSFEDLLACQPKPKSTKRAK